MSTEAPLPPLQGEVATDDLGPIDKLVPLILHELRAMAHRQLAREREPRTLQTTDLVHEAYLRLARDGAVTRHGRAYFYAAAARAMRQILVDAARRRNTARRGGGRHPISLDRAGPEIAAYGVELLALDEALQELARRHPRAARTVECRFFGGMSVVDTAAALGVSARTVKSDWAMARAWLYERLERGAA